MLLLAFPVNLLCLDLSPLMNLNEHRQCDSDDSDQDENQKVLTQFCLHSIATAAIVCWPELATVKSQETER